MSEFDGDVATGALTQIWMRAPGSESRSPERTSRVHPEVRIAVQVWQIPMRQPCSGASPAFSACSRTVAPVLEATIPDSVNDTEPDASSGSTTYVGGVNSSVCSRSEDPASV